jgi:hypothetical protein
MDSDEKGSEKSEDFYVEQHGGLRRSGVGLCGKVGRRREVIYFLGFICFSGV